MLVCVCMCVCPAYLLQCRVHLGLVEPAWQPLPLLAALSVLLYHGELLQPLGPYVHGTLCTPLEKTCTDRHIATFTLLDPAILYHQPQVCLLVFWGKKMLFVI